MSFVPTVPLHLPEEDFAELMQMAEQLGVEPKMLVVDALREFLNDHEAGKVALERLSDPRPTLSLEDMKRRLSF